MSAVLKLASVATGVSIFGAAASYSMRNSQQDFSRAALAEQTGEISTTTTMKPKLPSNFVSFTIRGYEFKNAA